jgi:hypothetical protein
MVTIKIGRKEAIFFGTIILVFVVAGFAVAYNSGEDPSVMGHDLNELGVINEDGSAVSLEQYIEDKIAGMKGGQLVCDPTPIYDSMILVQSNGETGIKYNDDSYKYNAGVKTVPAACLTDAGCMIKQEIYDSKGLKLTRQYSYAQYASNKWWSTYRTAGTYLNGDTSSVDVIPKYGGDYALYMRDDYYKSGTNVDYTKETVPTSWTFIDRTGSYGMKVYICSEGVPED